MSPRLATLATLNALGLALALVCNTLAITLPLNGMSTGELSDLYPNLFVPAGLTFSIWSLIYLGLLGLVVYGFVLASRGAEDNALDRIGPWFVLNMLLNAAWIFAWHWLQVGLSLVLMLGLLASLIWMYLRLEIGRRPAGAGERWLVRVPICIYLGWISVATIANTTALAVHLGASSYGSLPAGLAVGMVATAALLAVRMLQDRLDLAFALVVMWALLGIYLARSDSSAAGARAVEIAALIGLAGLGIALIPAARARWRDGAEAFTP